MPQDPTSTDMTTDTTIQRWAEQQLHELDVGISQKLDKEFEQTLLWGRSTVHYSIPVTTMIIEQDFINRGWTRRTDMEVNMHPSAQYSHNAPIGFDSDRNAMIFQWHNFWLIWRHYSGDATARVTLIDPSLLENIMPDPENFRITVPCNTVEDIIAITALLKSTTRQFSMEGRYHFGNKPQNT